MNTPTVAFTLTADLALLPGLVALASSNQELRDQLTSEIQQLEAAHPAWLYNSPDCAISKVIALKKDALEKSRLIGMFFESARDSLAKIEAAIRESN